MTKEMLLCKYGEIVLKGANRKYFEDMLCRHLRKRASSYGKFDIYRAQSTIYIEPEDMTADIDGMFEAAKKVFGIVAVGRVAVCEKNMDSIFANAPEYLEDALKYANTYTYTYPQRSQFTRTACSISILLILR